MNRNVPFILAATMCLPVCLSVGGGGVLAAEPGAQIYPARPIRMIVPQTPGGTADTVARTVTPGLSAALGQQIVIDNRGGAGGIIGTEMAAKAIPDGYTVSLNGAGPLTISPLLQKQVPYDPVKDFVPISLITISPFALVVHAAVPARSVKELIALAKAEPGKLNYASGGTGSVSYLGMELFKSLAGVNILHVPYKGTAPGMIDVLAGNITMILFAVPPAAQHAAAGRLRMLGVSSANRSPQYPDIPTIREAGMTGYEVTTWTGLLLPLKTPTPVVAKLGDALAKTIRAPETRRQLESQGLDIITNTSNEFSEYIRAELAKHAKIIKAAGAG